MPDQNWQFELEEYIKQGEPDRAEKSEAWQTAIGLQAVDGLNTSAYLLDTAKDHIEGKITIDEAQQRIHSYYEQRTTRTEIENETKEADIVSARIAKLLGEKTFQFSPAEWITIHRRLFEGVFDHAGQIRKYILGQFFGKLCHIMIAIPSSWCGIELGVNGSLLKVRPNILFLNFIAPSFLARSLAGHLAAFE